VHLFCNPLEVTTSVGSDTPAILLNLEHIQLLGRRESLTSNDHVIFVYLQDFLLWALLPSYWYRQVFSNIRDVIDSPEGSSQGQGDANLDAVSVSGALYDHC
jgi:hypothetical protein